MTAHSWTGVMLFGAFALTSANAADLTNAQKDGICRVSLARINANASGDYRSRGKVADTFVYVSARGYTYECEVFSDGMAFTLSSVDWRAAKTDRQRHYGWEMLQD